jgi:murein DD-endopeptidase MepM/ murein hydrolase activator NlpD
MDKLTGAKRDPVNPHRNQGARAGLAGVLVLGAVVLAAGAAGRLTALSGVSLRPFSLKFLGTVRAAGATTPSAVTRVSWPPLSGPTHLLESYGWRSSGRGMVFEPGLLYQGDAGRAVRAGPGGRVVYITSGPEGWIIGLNTGRGFQIRVGPLVETDVSRGSVVDANAQLGTTGSRPVLVEVTKDGYPVDPEEPGLLGERLRRGERP